MRAADLLILTGMLCAAMPGSGAARRTVVAGSSVPAPRGVGVTGGGGGAHGDHASAGAPDSTGPVVLEGGRSGSRALVVALHGGTWTGKPPRERAERLLNDLSADARRAGLRLLVPLLPDVADRSEEGRHVPWLSPQSEALVLAIIAREVEEGRADSSRVYLAGHGAGASGALMLAARHHDLLAGVAGWAGVPSPLWDEQRRVVGLAEDVVTGLRRVAVYLWTGQDDEVIDRATLRRFVDALTIQREQLGGAALLLEEGPGEHDFGPQGPGKGLRFLKKQRKQKRS